MRVRPIELALVSIIAAATAASATFVTFESGQVRPLALAPSGDRLFVVNTPDNRLEIFTVDGVGLTRAGSVPVGLEPVAVAARTDGEVWVVNHLSDSVSIVDVDATPPRVVRTLLVGDEPRDIVFAGPGGRRAFISTARRGQNLPTSVPPRLTTAATPRALVFVFDALALADSAAGDPLAVVELFGDTPRALAATPDGSRVYAAVFHSGNHTTALSEGVVCNDFNLNDDLVAGPCTLGAGTMPGATPLPERSADGVPRPEAGLIVKFDPGSATWRDGLGRDWSGGVRFDLPDHDVFVLDALADPPAQLAGAAGVYAGVGTVLFNMAVNPSTPARVYVTNTEARNEVRFEGPGVIGGSTVRGHLHEARITVLENAAVTPRHLNKHIDYGVVPSPAGVKDASLATPTGLAIDSAGAVLYVAAFGSSKIGVFSTAALEDDTFVPSAADHVALTGGGPSGLVLDQPRGRLYVLTRFDNAVAVVDVATQMQIATVALHNPEPPAVVAGRRFLYDARFTSSNGEASCSSCHVFGDFDSLAWDLGDPDGTVLNNPNPLRVPDVLGMSFPDHHPMKGPMTTQSLRGMANHGPMHWRGDRTGGNDPGGDPLDEDAAFKKFNVAFDGLIGRGSQIPSPDMQAFTDFILAVTYPPNPIRALDDSLTPEQQAGRDFYFGPQSDVFQDCNGCHRLDRAAGFFGSDGFMSFEFETQLFKIPHLRNLYQKIGMFGMPPVTFFNAGNNGHQGDQVRGFGFLHDGSVDTVFRFHNASVFNRTSPGGLPFNNPQGIPDGAQGDQVRRELEAFMLAFDSDLFPIVGQQMTLTDPTGGTDQLVAGKKLVIRDHPDDQESKRSVRIVSRDAAIAIGAPDGANDPRCGDAPTGTVRARLTLRSSAGESHTTPLPCQNWRLLGSVSRPRGFRYSDRALDDGTAKRVVWRTGLLRATLGGRGPATLDFDLQPGVVQGVISVELGSNGLRTCLECQGDGSDGRVLESSACAAPTACTTPSAGARVALLLARADRASPPECDLVVRGVSAGEARSWLYDRSTDDFQSDRVGEPRRADAALRALAGTPGQALTYLCVPPGSGNRIALDRDEDGFFDRDELDAGSDPADPGSTP